MYICTDVTKSPETALRLLPLILRATFSTRYKTFGLALVVLAVGYDIFDCEYRHIVCCAKLLDLW